MDIPSSMTSPTMLYWASNNDALLLGAWWWFLASGLCIAVLGGCGDIYNAEPGTEWPDSAPAAIANIEYAIVSALQAAQVKASNLLVSIFNMAGADWPEDFSYLHAAMEARGFGRTILVQNDAMGVLHAGSSDDTGVSVVCGTGAAMGARAPDGRTWHSSMWQNPFQGAMQLGQKTLDAVYLAELGINPPTALKRRILDFFRIATIEEVLHLCTRRERASPVYADQLTPLLLHEAHNGDAVARAIAREHGEALGKYALVAARQIGIEGTPFTLVLAGGVFRHPSSLLIDAIVSSVQATSPRVRPTRCRFEPIVGVLFTVLETARVAIDDALLAKLLPTIPALTLFSTVLD